MNGLQQIFGIFRKEFALQSRDRLNLLSRLLIGPTISAATVGTLYAGLFQSYEKLQLGPLNAQNFAPHILLGFLIHMYVNSGYYFFSQKVLNEWIGHTLTLHWIAPCSPWFMVLGLMGVDAIRCAVLGGFTFLILGSFYGLPIISLTWICLSLVGVFLFGIGLGVLRALCFLLNEGKAELADTAYMGLIFTACLYIPLSILPGWLRPLCELNPLFHANQLIQNLWWERAVEPISYLGLIGGLSLLLACVQITWHHKQVKILERSFG